MARTQVSIVSARGGLAPLRRTAIRIAAIGLVGSALVLSAEAQVPMLLNYQGRLTDAAGQPRSGGFTMTFAFFDAITGGGKLPATAPWEETQAVQVVNGTFNVLLGSVTPLPVGLFVGGPSDQQGPLRFLQVIVSGETLSPRTRIVSAPYAVHARIADFAPSPVIPPVCTIRTFTKFLLDVPNANRAGAATVVACNPGEVLTGGGCNGVGDSGVLTPDLTGFPRPDSSFECRATAFSFSETVTSYAICCRFTPEP